MIEKNGYKIAVVSTNCFVETKILTQAIGNHNCHSKIVWNTQLMLFFWQGIYVQGAERKSFSLAVIEQTP